MREWLEDASCSSGFLLDHPYVGECAWKCLLDLFSEESPWWQIG